MCTVTLMITIGDERIMELHDGIRVVGLHGERYDEIFTPEALTFLGHLHNTFAPRRCELLAERRARRERIAAGEDPDFLKETKDIREDPDWRVAPPAPGLNDRRVEITGPTSRSMTVNALNSGAKVWLADFEDATSPTWHNIVTGQLNLVDALDRRINFTAESGKEYRLGTELPTIVVRPRGWHLPEKHILVNGSSMSGSLVDFGLYLFHCAQRQLERGSGPYFYLPKLENHLEARLWNDVFRWSQAELGIPYGTIRATVLIETITAAFEMDEILYELRDHSAGLNAGRWDYTFSLIKNFRTRGERFVLPDRSALTMTTPFMRAYTELLVRTCHRRGAHAIGGMAAFVPDRRDPTATAVAFEKVRADKEREARDGFDGSWVAHPDLVPICRDVFDSTLGERPHQLDRTRDEVDVSAEDLLSVETAIGEVTEAGLRANVRVCLGYLDAWLDGNGAVAIDHLMEDAATVEIARSQVWQWLHYGTRLSDGRRITRRLVDFILDEEYVRWRRERPSATHLDPARELFTEVALGPDYPSFTTVSAYARYLVTATE
jgi:malate synthase